MRNLIVLRSIALFVFAGLLPAVDAQETPQYELFGGYSNVRPDNRVSRGAGQGGIVGATFYVKENWGISGDWSGSWFRKQYGSFVFMPDSSVSGESKTDRQYFLVGPRYRLFNTGRFAISVRVAAGAMRSGTEGFSDLIEGADAEPVRTDFEYAEWKFLTSFGGSFDWKLSDRFAWRVVQPEVLYWRSFENQTDLRISTGLVFRFGK